MVFKAVEILDPSFKDILKHVGVGMVQLISGKRGSRFRNIIGAVQLIDTTVDAINTVVNESRDSTADEKDKVSEMAGQGAVKY